MYDIVYRYCLQKSVVTLRYYSTEGAASGIGLATAKVSASVNTMQVSIVRLGVFSTYAYMSIYIYKYICIHIFLRGRINVYMYKYVYVYGVYVG